MLVDNNVIRLKKQNQMINSIDPKKTFPELMLKKNSQVTKIGNQPENVEANITN